MSARRGRVVLTALVALLWVFVQPSPASATTYNYTGPCSTGEEAQAAPAFQFVTNMSSPVGGIYGVYSDVTFSQELAACNPTYGGSGLAAIIAANLTPYSSGPDQYGDLVQLGIARRAGWGRSQFLWTSPAPQDLSADCRPDSCEGKSTKATWFDREPSPGHTYRMFIWAAEDSLGLTWNYCIIDRYDNHEKCNYTEGQRQARTWGHKSLGNMPLHDGFYFGYETHNTADRMGSPCCLGSAISISNMHYMASYMGNRNWVGPLSASSISVQHPGWPYEIPMPTYYHTQCIVTGCTTWQTYTNPVWPSGIL